MAITNFGQALSSASANSVYLLKTEDDIVTGILSLQNGVDINKHITDSQEFLFTLSDVLGVVGESDPNAKVYSSQEIISGGDDRKVAIGKIDAQVKLTLDASLLNTTNIAAILASVGQPLGVAELDAAGKVPLNQLPDGLFTYLGNYDANTNTPTLIDGIGDVGSVYRVDVAGTQDFGSGAIIFNLNDKVVYNASLVWEKWDVVEENPIPNVTNDAQLKREAGDFNTFTEKVVPVNDDIVLIEDSADSFNKKKVKLSNMLGGGGAGGINYMIDNSDAESGIGDWLSPVPAEMSIATAALDNIRGENLYLVRKESGNFLGSKVRCPFTIDKADLGKELVIRIETRDQGSYVDDSFKINIVAQPSTDITTITNTSLKVLGAGLTREHIITFQSDITVQDYFFEIVTDTADVAVQILWVDNIRVGPESVTKSLGKTSWVVSFTDTGVFSINENNTALSFNKDGAGLYRIYFNEGRFPSGAIVEPHIYRPDAGGPTSVIEDERGVDGTGAFVVFKSVNTSNVGTSLTVADELQIIFRQKEEDQVAFRISTDLGNRDLRIFAQGNDGGSVTANTENVNWTQVDDTTGGSMWDGDTLTAPDNGSYTIKAVQLLTTGSVNVDAYIDKNDGSGFVKQYRLLFAATATLNISDNVYLKRGWKYAIRLATTKTLSNSTDAYISISKQGDDAPILSPTAPQITIFKDIKPNTTNAGTFTSGAWQVRDLTSQEGLSTFATLNTDQITIQPGKYFIKAEAPAFNVDGHKIRFINITDPLDEIVGKSAFINNTGEAQALATLTGILSITQPQTYELQHRCTVTRLNEGFGRATSFAVDEVYSEVTIQKIY